MTPEQKQILEVVDNFAFWLGWAFFAAGGAMWYLSFKIWEIAQK
jgi:hypothetical protein